LLHGFDSSLLEFRRLLPLLEQRLSCVTVVPDLHGCGFTGDAGLSVFPASRRAHLRSLLEALFPNQPVTLLGASLGGACALDFALEHPELVHSLILVDAQAFVEGAPSPPSFLADLGLDVLRSEWLRSIANQLAYFDKMRLATTDALRVGRLHTFLPRWKPGLRSWMENGGYRLADRIRAGDVKSKSLVVWGRQDEIVPPADAEKLRAALGGNRVAWIEQCGHCAQLEAPEALADEIAGFVVGSEQAALSQ
jgi:pimeloyl-ACP methyl ester carboxylesterase